MLVDRRQDRDLAVLELKNRLRHPAAAIPHLNPVLPLAEHFRHFVCNRVAAIPRVTAELIHDTRDLPYTYKGESTVIPGVEGDFCPACAESLLGAAESERVMQEMRLFSKQVSAAIVDPNFIIGVRKKLALGQREAAEIFGGGVNAFSRYENGKTKPSLALVKLLRVLDHHPDLLNEIRDGA